MANITSSVNQKNVSTADLSGQRANGADRRDALIQGAHQQAALLSDPYAGELIDAAARYASIGWVTIPVDLRAGKTPACQWKGLTASSAAGNVPRQKQAIQRLGAANTGIAVLTAQSGLTVIDVDAKEIAGCPFNDSIDDAGNSARGSARFEALYEMAGINWTGNETAFQSTPSGGMHIVYRARDLATIQTTVSRHVRGVDVRAGWPCEDGSYRSGGYFIAAPTRTQKGVYTWGTDLDAITELPKALGDLLHTKPGKDGTLEVVNPTSHDAGTGRFAGEPTDDASGQRWVYAARVMQAELQRLRDAAPSTRNHTLNAVAFRLGQLDEAGMLDDAVRESITDDLIRIAQEIGQNEHEAFATVLSGWTAGHDKPDAKLAAIGLPKDGPLAQSLPVHSLGAASAANTAAEDLLSLVDEVRVAINARLAGDEDVLFDDTVVEAAAQIMLTDSVAYERLRADVKRANAGRISQWENEVAHAAKRVNDAATAVASEAAWPKLNPNTGRPIGAIDNVAHAMRHLGVTLYHDEFAGVARLRTTATNEFSGFAEIDDAAMRALLIACEGLGLKVDKAAFIDYVLELCRRNSEHPVRDYLDALVWDGIPRLDDWLTVYADVGDDPYSRAVGRLFLVAAVRRARDPGVKFDTLVVFEGHQGAGKSSLLRALAGNDWFSDAVTLGDDPKVMIEQTRGKWVVEIPELSGMGSRDVERIKAQLSRQSDRARLAFGRATSEVPRQFVLAGTTNGSARDGYLADRTGNRRFLPISVGRIDLAGIARDRDQLWAEAAYLDAQGESIQLPKSLWQAAAQVTEQRVSASPLEEVLTELIGGLAGFIPLPEVYRAAGLDTGNIARASGQRGREVKRVLERAGWREARRRMAGNARARGYENDPSGPTYVFGSSVFVVVR